MLPAIPLIASGGVLYAGLRALRKSKPPTLITALANTPPPPKPGMMELTTALQRKIVDRVTTFDNQYQTFMQKTIDPLLGKQRHAQMQEILSEEALALTDDERFANRRLALGGLALVFGLAGQFIYAPLALLGILLGCLMVWNLYLIAYFQWRQNRRLGVLHLTCIYVAVLWLGGYATIGALGSLLMAVALKIKAITENQAQNNLVDVFQLRPSKVWVRNNDVEIEIPFEQLQRGDTLVLHAGQVVPVDGTITHGVATLDQHMLTGEAQPVEKGVGDAVFASTVLLSGKIDIIVEKTGTETTAGQIGEILKQTAHYNSTTALKVIELSDRFTWPTLTLSALSWPFIGPIGAISLLGANSTFNTWVSGPVAILNFLNIAANASILVKDGGALEKLNKVDTIVFDKTGTLTLEQPTVAQIHPFNQTSEAGVLLLAAAAEARQTHPIARAILTAAEQFALDLPRIEQAHYDVGLGLKVQLAGDARLIRVGSSRFMTMEGIALPQQVDGLTKACQDQGHSLVMVAADDVLVGCIELRPTVRPEAQQIIQGLQAHNLALYIISGDQEAPTRKLAADLGMNGYFANTLPEAKADLVEQLQAQGRRVCFIGDGINDAIAMRRADVSISLRGATTAATDTAQIILMDGNLNRLLYLLQLAKEFEGNLKRNFLFTASVSLVAVTGILFAGFTFAATEIFYAVSLFGGLGIAIKPLLDHKKQP